MLFTKDMKDLVRIFEKHGVRYTLVGGFAVNYYGYVRVTEDVDFLVYPSRENARQIMVALEEFGFGKAGIPRNFFEKAGAALHLGVEPNRIDLLTRLKGVANDRIFTRIRKIKYEGLRINIISRDDLVRAKRRSARLKDLADAEELMKIDSLKHRKRKTVKKKQ